MHQPVMLNEVVELLAVVPGGRYIDGTAGNGGHTAALLAGVGAGGAVLAIDRDPAAVSRLRARFAESAPHCHVVHGNFADMASFAAALGWDRVDGILLDLGVSSDQLDTPERGF